MKKNKVNNEEQKILDFLKSNPESYSNIKELSDATNLSYPTTLKRVEILERLGLIKVIIVGNNKVCMLKKENG